jgi:protein TonB
MFEDATFESSGRIRTRSRRWMVAALLCNGSILLAMIVIPLIYPDALPRHMIPMLMEVPLTQPPEPKPIPQQPHEQTAARTYAPLNTQFTAPRIISIGIPRSDSRDDAPNMQIAFDSPGQGIPDGSRLFRGPQGGPSVQLVERKGPVRISSTELVSLVQKTIPVYPAIAKTAGIQGTVVLEAVISKSGTIENLRVVSGSPMLQRAAMDAVKQWRYKPFVLNGEPIEVETTVNVEFRMGQ